MKQRYDIEVAGVKLSIATDDGAEFVEKTVAEFESSVQNVLRVGKNFSKLDAIILSALDYCGEFRKAEDKIRNLEAQIEILEARVQKDADTPVVTNAPAAAPEVPASEEETPEEEEVPAEETPVTADNSDSDDDDGTDDSFRELEAFLGSQLSLGFGEE